jgi:hypothetical protein
MHTVALGLRAVQYWPHSAIKGIKQSRNRHADTLALRQPLDSRSQDILLLTTVTGVFEAVVESKDSKEVAASIMMMVDVKIQQLPRGEFEACIFLWD